MRQTSAIAVFTLHEGQQTDRCGASTPQNRRGFMYFSDDFALASRPKNAPKNNASPEGYGAIDNT